MKKLKSIKVVVLMLTVMIFATGCNQKKETEQAIVESTSQEEKAPENETRIFKDSAGRDVEIPTKITKIAPSGSLSQIVLYTSCPDLLIGLANSFSEEAKEYIDKKYWDLPEFGQFYGKNSSLNMEALSAADPDIVIDIGEPKKTVKEDMDKIQEQLDIPVVFIEANLDGMAEAYAKLGELLGDTTTTDKLSKYSKKVIDKAEKIKNELAEEDKKSIYLASGTAGLDTNAAGSFHAQVIDTIGAMNAATDVDIASTGSGTTVSMEQIMQWQPDYIITGSSDVYELIMNDPTWKDLVAVKEKRVYKIPSVPYNFMGFPPSVNRLMGVQWLGNLVYPDKYKLDIEEETAKFYELFYHADVSPEQVKTILENAI